MSDLVAVQLRKRGLETTISDSLDVFKKLCADEFQLIVLNPSTCVRDVTQLTSVPVDWDSAEADG
jgi:hypothetical protein